LAVACGQHMARAAGSVFWTRLLRQSSS
jgi:hypothetical protein